MLNEKDLQNFKEQLEKDAGELEARLKELSKSPDFGNDVETDFSEEADEAEEFAANLGEADTFKTRLQAVETALDKMAKGEYGKCETCGMDIELEVFKAAPESKLCKTCKNK